MKNFAICLSILTCTLIPLPAQQDEGEPAKKTRGRQAWFVYTSMPEGLENPVSVMSGKDISEILLSKLSASEPVKIPADGILRIVRRIENPKDPEKPAYLTLAQASVPETVSAAMIILMPAAKNADGLLFQTKVQDLAAMKGGDTMFLNMTKLQIGIELGREKFLVTPGQAKIHNPLGAKKTVSLPIRLSFFHPERKEWDMITASTVALYSTRRELCIFNWDSRFNRVDFESITFPMID
ncbi:hypothetical protein HZ994_09830 [Akkermansiaceae bacterium]|nr:hypothetical protein HZ994_09830 [Akkermansiaceae bacterium]